MNKKEIIFSTVISLQGAGSLLIRNPLQHIQNIADVAVDANGFVRDFIRSVRLAEVEAGIARMAMYIQLSKSCEGRSSRDIHSVGSRRRFIQADVPIAEVLSC